MLGEGNGVDERQYTLMLSTDKMEVLLVKEKAVMSTETACSSEG